MAPNRVPSRSASPATSIVSTKSTASTARSTVSSASSNTSSKTTSSSSSSKTTPQALNITIPAHCRPHLVLITGLPPHNSTKQAVQAIISRFIPKLPVSQLIAVPEGIVVQSPVDVKQELLNTIGAAQFGPHARITSKIPASSLTATSVVIRGVDTKLPESQVREELLGQKMQVQRVMRIKNNKGPTFMVRVWSSDEETLQYLLNRGAYINKKRHRVEPSFELAAASAAST